VSSIYAKIVLVFQFILEFNLKFFYLVCTVLPMIWLPIWFLMPRDPWGEIEIEFWKTVIYDGSAEAIGNRCFPKPTQDSEEQSTTDSISEE